MKTYLLLFLFSLPVLTSCMRDDLDVCYPDENLVLNFRYQSNGDDLFDENITHVDALLFNRDQQIIASKRVERESLQQFRGTGFKVAPGEYYLVCWANAGVNASITGVESQADLSACGVANTAFRTGDPLYYGPSEQSGELTPSTVIRVEGKEQTNYTVDFQKAHRRVRIYVEGVSDYRGTTNLPSTLQIANTPVGYDFLLNLNTSQRITYEGVAEWIEMEGRTMAYATFYLPIYQETDGIEVRLVKSSDNSVTTHFSLGEYLKSNPPTDTYDVGVHIRYLNVGFEITMPGWNGSTEITPGW